MYETYYDKLQSFLAYESLELHYMDRDSFVSSNKTRNINNDLKNPKDLFDFSNLNENHEFSVIKMKKS